jgi:exodeoxyribonuclease VII large subunit
VRLVQQMQGLDDLEQRLSRGLRQNLVQMRTGLIGLQSRLWQSSPAARVRDAAARQSALYARLTAAQLERLRHARERLLPLVRTLQAVSPLATLSRGYAIVSGPDGEILRDAAQAPGGTLIEARLAHGRLRARIVDSAP